MERKTQMIQSSIFDNSVEHSKNEIINEIFIGDNLTILKSKQIEKYINEVDFIYIDPPYNTHNKFSYNDSNNSWEIDIENRLFESKKLMKKTAVIFISIDDSEFATLKFVCNKVFGIENYIGVFITKQAQRSNSKHINVIHEYVLCYAKNKNFVDKFVVKRIDVPEEKIIIENLINNVKSKFLISREEAERELKDEIKRICIENNITWLKNYSNIDNNGNIFFAKDLSTPGNPMRLDIDEINLHLPPLKTRGWSSKDKILKLHNDNRLAYKNGRPYEIEYLVESEDNVSSILDFYSRQGTNELKKLGLYGIFDTPKPVALIKFLIRVSMHHDATILDFYAGSGTTAQAVYEINKEDNRNHRYVLMQRDEMVNKGTKSYEFLREYGIAEPKVSDVLQIRIDTYLRLNNREKDYLKVEI